MSSLGLGRGGLLPGPPIASGCAKGIVDVSDAADDAQLLRYNHEFLSPFMQGT